MAVSICKWYVGRIGAEQLISRSRNITGVTTNINNGSGGIERSMIHLCSSVCTGDLHTFKRKSVPKVLPYFACNLNLMCLRLHSTVQILVLSLYLYLSFCLIWGKCLVNPTGFKNNRGLLSVYVGHRTERGQR